MAQYLEDLSLKERMDLVNQGKALPPARKWYNATIPQSLGASMDLLNPVTAYSELNQRTHDFLAEDPQGLAILEDAKDIGRGTVQGIDDIASYLGDTVGKGYTTVKKKLTQTREEEQADQYAADLVAAKESQGQAARMAQLRQALSQGFGGAGGAGGAAPGTITPGATIDLGGVPANPQFDQIRSLLAAGKPGPMKELTGGDRDEAKFLGLLQGALGAGAQPDVGHLLLSAATGLKTGEAKFDDMLAAREGAQAQAQRDYINKAVETELKLLQEGRLNSQASAPKVIPTRAGVMVQQTVTGPDGSNKTVLKPFSIEPFMAARQMSGIAGALGGGAGKVAGLTIGKDIGDAYGSELALLGTIDANGLLPQFMASIPGLDDDLAEIEIQTSQSLQGARETVVADAVLKNKLAYLARLMNTEDEVFSSAAELLGASVGE